LYILGGVKAKYDIKRNSYEGVLINHAFKIGLKEESKVLSTMEAGRA